MTANMVAPLECPSCGEFDQCADGCACPICFPFKGDPDTAVALDAWKRLAGVMLDLTENEVPWAWTRTRHGDGFAYGLEITYEGHEYAVTLMNTRHFDVETNRVLRRATDTDPAQTEWTWITSVPEDYPMDVHYAIRRDMWGD